MRHGVSAGWGVYVAGCAVLPLLWGTVVAWVLRRLPEPRLDDVEPGRPLGTGTREEDFRI